MTRCPNCYNSITPDTQSCPSCAYSLIQTEKTPLSQLSGVTSAQARGASGRLQPGHQVRTSGRLRPPEQSAGDEEKPRGAYSSARGSGHVRRPAAVPRPRKGARELADEEQARLRKRILIAAAVAGIVATLVLFLPALQVIAPQVDAQTSISTLTTFRSQPSKTSGKSVDQVVNEWLDESRRSGKMVGYSGWSVKPVRFNKSKVVLGFSFEERDGIRTAEWLADVGNNTFVPKNELAAEVYGNK